MRGLAQKHDASLANAIKQRPQISSAWRCKTLARRRNGMSELMVRDRLLCAAQSTNPRPHAAWVKRHVTLFAHQGVGLKVRHVLCAEMIIRQPS